MGDDDVTTLKERADALGDLGRDREAVPLLLQALTIDPDDVSILTSLARLHYILDDHAACLRYADRAIEADPEWHRGYYWRCWALHSLNWPEEALEAAEEATSLEPENKYNLNILAWMQQKCGQAEEAECTAQRLLTIAPEWSDAHFRMAWIYGQQQRLHLAEAYYRKSLEIDPLGAVALNNLALICNKLGRKREATELYCRALTVDPSEKSAKSNLQDQIHAEGFASIEEYLRGREDTGLAAHVQARLQLLKQGRALLEQGKSQQAVQLLTDSFARYKSDIPFLDLLAEAYMEQKALPSALQLADAVIAAAPANPMGYRRRAMTLVEMTGAATGDTLLKLRDDAITAAEEFERLETDRSWGLALLITVQRDCQLFHAAVQTANRLIELWPQWAYSYFYLATVYERQELWRLAEMYCRKALEHEPNSAELVNELGVTLSRQKRVEEAIACYTRAVKLDPNTPHAAHNLRRARAAQKGWKGWIAIGVLLYTEWDEIKAEVGL